MMNRRENSESIPMDLILEILSRLPVKSVVRFRRVSKTWKSIICRQDFIKLFRTMSSSNPRLLIVVKQVGDWPCLTTTASGSSCCFSSPQPRRNHYGNVVDADFQTKFFEDSSPDYFSYASGLFYFSNMRISKKCEDAKRVIYNNPSTGQYEISKEYGAEGPTICNPITGQYAILPPPDLRTTYRDRVGLLGFDPIGKQFKVLEGKFYDEKCKWVCQILTLETEDMRWREIKCPRPDSSGICIDGVLYYKSSNRICCFDVRSEKFMITGWSPFISIYEFQSLINYKGKLCGSSLKYGYDGGSPLTLNMWVLEDVEKEEWSTYAYIIPLTLSGENKVVNVYYDQLSVVGVTVSGEIVLAKKKAYKPFYVFYFNPETNTLRSIEIQGVEEKVKRNHRVHCFVDHVEDPSFDVMKTTTSIRSPEQSTSRSSRDEHQD